MSDQDETVYISGTIERVTPKAVLFRFDPDEDAEWVPKSVIVDKHGSIDGIVTLELPEWLAEERGMA